MHRRFVIDALGACSHCGSARVYPKVWIQGFFPTVNAERQIYVCRDCGREGMLLTFETDAQRSQFAAEKREGVPDEPAAAKADAIPILPVDAVPLLEVKGIDAIPIYRPKVVDVTWADRRLRRGGYRVDIDRYWDAVGGSRYNAESLYVLDLAGINHRSPNFDALRAITKRAEVLLDLGARQAEDVMDGFMIDVESVIVGTKNLESLVQFEEIHEISEGVIPCLDIADGVVWHELSHEDRDLRVVAAALHAIGFPSLAAMDLRRLCTFSGPDPRLVSVLADLDFETMLGGGVREEDVTSMREAGIDTALIDPFTPVIRSLLPTESEELPAEALPSPQPRPDARGAPAPG